MKGEGVGPSRLTASGPARKMPQPPTGWESKQTAEAEGPAESAGPATPRTVIYGERIYKPRVGAHT